MSLLPVNESNLLKSLDDALGSRIEAFFDVNFSSVPKSCDARYLTVLAKSLDADISGLSEEEARAFLEGAIYLKQYAGTPSVLKKALSAIFSNVEINDQVGGYLFDVSVEAKNDVSIQKLKKIKEIANRYKNVRSKLRNFIINLPNIEASYKVAPFCVFGVDAQSQSIFRQDMQAQIENTNVAAYRVQFDIDADTFIDAKAQIENTNVAAYRVQFDLPANAFATQNTEIKIQGGLTWQL